MKLLFAAEHTSFNINTSLLTYTSFEGCLKDLIYIHKEMKVFALSFQWLFVCSIMLCSTLLLLKTNIVMTVNLIKHNLQNSPSGHSAVAFKFINLKARLNRIRLKLTLKSCELIMELCYVCPYFLFLLHCFTVYWLGTGSSSRYACILNM